MSDIVDIGLSVDSRQVSQGTRALDKFGREATIAGRSTSQLNRTLSHGKVLFGAFAAAAAAAAAAYSIKKTAEFGQALAELSAITGATGKDLEFLRQKSLELGTTTTQSAVDVAGAFKLVASAKPDLLENAAALASVTKEVVTLSEAASIDLTTAADTVGGALNQFGADADQAARFVNVLAAGAKFGASEIADTAQALKVAGTVAAGAGLSFEQTTAAIEAMAKVSLKGSLAGTGLRGVLLKLSTQSRDEFNPEIVGFTKALQNLGEAELTTAEKKKLFGQESITAANALIKEADSLGILTDKLTGTNTATEQAAINTNTLHGDVKRLKSAAEGLAISLGTKTNPALRVFTQGITEIIVGMRKAERESNAYKKNIDNLTLSVASVLDTIARFARDLTTPFVIVGEAIKAVINQFIAISKLQFREALDAGAAGAAAMYKALKDASDPAIVNRFSNIAKGIIDARDATEKHNEEQKKNEDITKADTAAQKDNVEAINEVDEVLVRLSQSVFALSKNKSDLLAIEAQSLVLQGATTEQLQQYLVLRNTQIETEAAIATEKQRQIELDAEKLAQQEALFARAQALTDLQTLQANPPMQEASDNELVMLQERQDQKLAMIADHNALVIQAQINAGMSLDTIQATFAQQEMDREKNLKEFKIQQAGAAFGMAANFMQNLTVIAGKEGGAMFEIMKGFAIADALITTYGAAQDSYKAGAKLGGPILGAAFAAVAMASGLARVAQIKATEPGSTAGNTIGTSGQTNPGFTGGGPDAGPPPVPVTQQEPPPPIIINIENNSDIETTLNGINDLVDKGHEIKVNQVGG